MLEYHPKRIQTQELMRSKASVYKTQALYSSPLEKLRPFFKQGQWLQECILGEDFAFRPAPQLKLQPLAPEWGPFHVRYAFLSKHPELRYFEIQLNLTPQKIHIQTLKAGQLQAPVFKTLNQRIQSWWQHLDHVLQNPLGPPLQDLPPPWSGWQSHEQLVREFWAYLQFLKHIDPIQLQSLQHWPLKNLLELCSDLLQNKVLKLGYVLPGTHQLRPLDALEQAHISPDQALDTDISLFLTLPTHLPWGLLPPQVAMQKTLAPARAFSFSWPQKERLGLNVPSDHWSTDILISPKGSPTLKLDTSLPTGTQTVRPKSQVQIVSPKGGELRATRTEVPLFFHWGHLLNSQWIQDIFPQILPPLSRYCLGHQIFVGVDFVSESFQAQPFLKHAVFQWGGHLIQAQKQVVLLGFSHFSQALKVAFEILRLFQVAESLELQQSRPKVVLHQGGCQVFCEEGTNHFLGTAVRQTFELLNHAEGLDAILSHAAFVAASSFLHALPGEIIQFQPDPDSPLMYQWYLK